MNKDFKVGDHIKITNKINDNVVYGVLIEFNDESFIINAAPTNNPIKCFYKPFLKIERVESDG